MQIPLKEVDKCESRGDRVVKERVTLQITSVHKESFQVSTEVSEVHLRQLQPQGGQVGRQAGRQAGREHGTVYILYDLPSIYNRV